MATLITFIPEGVGRFTGFTTHPFIQFSLSNGSVVFVGEGFIGQRGIYIDIDGFMSKVIDIDDVLDGELISFGGLRLNRETIYGNRLAFHVQFVNGQFAIYRATINCLRGDANGDGLLNGWDVAALTASLLDPKAATVLEFCAADVNMDGSVDGTDIADFVAAVLSP